MVKDNYRTTEGAAESWFLGLQDKNKKGENINKYYTTFINIQQVTKQGDFAGSNRLKHMTDAMCHVERSKDGLARSLHFSKIEIVIKILNYISQFITIQFITLTKQLTINYISILLENMTQSDLVDVIQERLEWCVETERYEMAAKLRDLIKYETTDEEDKHQYYLELLKNTLPKPQSFTNE